MKRKMSKRRERLSAVILALALALSLTGCGSVSGTQTGTASTIAETQETSGNQNSDSAAQTGDSGDAHSQEGILLKEEGYFAVGGTVVANDGEIDPDNLLDDYSGQTVHGDHAVVEYQIPVDAKQYPIVFEHGINLSGRCWSTTPDGREGFREYFLRKGYSTYIVDQPRRGNASRAAVDATVPRNNIDQMWFNQSRLGKWPDFFEGVQFPQDEESMNQFYRMMTPDIGEQDVDVIVSAYTELLKEIGPSILITHSAGGPMGWYSAIGSDNVKGIVALEPGTFVFPEGEQPDPIPNLFTDKIGMSSNGMTVSAEDFEKLTRFPIIIYYGDYIPDEPADTPAIDYWRMTKQLSYEFADCINRHGGNATVIDLPKIGITGNTHFIMSDLNSEVIADHISEWMNKQGL